MHRQTRRPAAFLGAAAFVLPFLGPAPSGLAATVTLASGQAAVADPAFTPPEEAMRYHRVARRRPGPGIVFDRFVRSWLAEAPPATLEAFLREQAVEGEAADQLLLAMFLAAEGRSVDAITVFREALERFPASPAIRLEKARVEASTLDFETALEDLAAAAETLAADPVADPDLEQEIASLRGRYQARTGDTEAALATWNALLEQRPDDALLHEDVVQLQVEEGLAEAALETLERLVAITRDPAQRVAHRLWSGEILRDAGRDEPALEVYVGLLDDVGRDSWLEREVLAQIEDVHRRRGDLDAFATQVAELWEEDPTRLAFGRTLARVQAEGGDVDASLETWRSILERSPDDLELRRTYALRLADADRTDEAIAQLERLAAARPDDPAIPLRLAELLHRADRPDDAAAAIESFLERSGRDLSASMQAARTYQQMDRPEDALAVARAMVAAAPEDPDRRSALAELLHAQGETDEAVGIWRTLAREGGAGQAIAMARALRGRGEVDEARAALMQRVEEFADDPTYLAAVVEAAIGGEDAAEALPWGERWVAIAPTATETLRAVATTARLARRTGELVDLSERLQGRPTLNVGERCLLAEALELIGDTVAADQVLAAGVRAGGDDVDPRLDRQRVRLLALRRAWPEAAAAMEDLVQRPGQATSANFRELANLHRRAGDLEAAIESVRRWRTAVPGSTSPWLVEAELLRASADPEAAIELLEVAARRFDDAALRSELATAYAESGRLRRAETVLWGLYEDADSVTERVRWAGRMAELLRWSDRFDGLVEQLERRRTRERRDIGVYLALAEVHRVGESYEARRQALLEAARIDPDNLQLLLEIARVEEREGDWERSRRTLQRAQALGDGGQVTLRLARLSILEGDVAGAIAAITAPDAPELTIEQAIRFADELLAAGEIDAATEFTVARLAEHPQDVRLRYLLGVLEHERPGREAAARETMLSVLDADEEPPTASSAPGSSMMTSMAQQLAMFGEVVSEDALAILGQQYAENDAFRHRQMRMNAFRVAMPNTSRAGLLMPGDLEHARALAIAHLRRLAMDLDDAEQAALRDAMAVRGVPVAGVLLSLSGESAFNAGWGPVLDEHPDEPALLELVGLTASFPGQDPWDIGAERLDAIGDRFAESNPTVAFGARCAQLRLAMGDGPEAVEALWPDVEAAMDRIERPRFWEVYFVGMLIGGGRGMGFASVGDLPEDVADAMAERIVAWYPQVDRTGPWASFLQQLLMTALLQREDYDELAALVVREIDDHRASPAGAAAARQQQQQMAMAMGGRFGGASVVQPLGFPPTGIESLPALALQLAPDPRIGMPTPGGVGVYPQLLAALDEQAADPLMRALLAATAGEDDRVDELLAPLLAADPPSLDALLVAGSWAARGEWHEEALQHLTAAAELPVSRAMRQMLDGAILASAIEVDGVEERPELVAAGRRSALRLMRAVPAPEARRPVLAALDALGLADEADALRDRMAASGRSPAGMSPPMPGQPTTPGSIERIREALADDRREAAARLAMRELESIAQQVAAGNAWMRQQPPARMLDTLIRAEGLEDDIVAIADPGEGASPARQMRFASILDALGRPDEAVAAYERALAERFVPEAAVRLAELHVGRGDGEAAGEILTRLDPARHGMALTVFLQPRTQTQELEPRLARAEAVATFVEASDPEALERLAVDLGTMVFFQLTQAAWGQTARLPHMDQIDADVQPGMQAFADRRQAVHDRLARVLLEHPPSASHAFSRLLMSAEAAGEDLEPLVDIAEGVLVAPLSRQARMSRSATAGMHLMMPTQGGVQMRTPTRPEVFLARMAGRAGDRERIDRVVATLREQRRREEAELLETTATLLMGDEATFLETARTILARHGTDPRTSQDPVIRRVAEAARDRGVDPAVVMDEVVDALARLAGSSFGWTSVAQEGLAFTGVLAEHAEEHGTDPRAAGRVFLERLADELVGPADEREERIRRNYQPGQWASGGLASRIRQYRDVAIGMASHPEYAPFVRELAGVLVDPEFDAEGARQLDVAFNEMIRSRVGATTVAGAARDEAVARLLRALDRLPITGDPGEFDPMAFASERGGWVMNASLLESAAAAIRGASTPVAEEGEEASPELRTLVQAWIDELDPPRLGATLLDLHLRDGNVAPAEWHEALGPWRERLLAAADDVIARVANGMPPGVLDAEDLDGPAAALAARLQGGVVDTLEEERVALMAIERLDPAGGLGVWDAWRRSVSVAGSLAARGRIDDAYSVLAHVLPLVESSPQGRGTAGRLAGELEQQAYREGVDAEAAAGLMRLLVRLAESEAIEVDTAAVLDRMPRLMNRIATAADEEGDETVPIVDGRRLDASERRHRTLLLRLAEVLEPEDAAIVTLGLARTSRWSRVSAPELRGVPPVERAIEAAPELPAWLAECARDADALARVGEAAERGFARDPVRPAVRERAEAVAGRLVASDDAQPASVRLAVAANLLGLVGEAAGPEVVSRAVELAATLTAEDPGALEDGWLRPMLQAWARSADGDRPSADADAIVEAYVREMTRRSATGMTTSVRHGHTGIVFEGSMVPSVRELLLELAAADGVDAGERRLLALADQNLAAMPSAWRTLVAAGGADEAAAAIRRWWSEAMPRRVVGQPYSEAMHAGLPALDAALDDAELSLLARAMIMDAPDPEPTGGDADVATNGDGPPPGASGDAEAMRPDGVPTRATRLAGLAREVLAHEFRRPLVERRLLALLAIEPAARGLLAERLAEAAGTVVFSAPEGYHADGRFWAEELVFAHVLATIDADDLRPTIEILEEVRDVEGAQNRWSLAESTRRLVGVAARRTLPGLLVAAPDRRRDCLEMLRAAVSGLARLGRLHSGAGNVDPAAEALVLGLLAEDDEAVAAWLESLEADEPPGSRPRASAGAAVGATPGDVRVGPTTVSAQGVRAALGRMIDGDATPWPEAVAAITRLLDAEPLEPVRSSLVPALVAMVRAEALVDHGSVVGERAGSVDGWASLAGEARRAIQAAERADAGEDRPEPEATLAAGRDPRLAAFEAEAWTRAEAACEDDGERVELAARMRHAAALDRALALLESVATEDEEIAADREKELEAVRSAMSDLAAEGSGAEDDGVAGAAGAAGAAEADEADEAAGDHTGDEHHG